MKRSLITAFTLFSIIALPAIGAEQDESALAKKLDKLDRRISTANKDIAAYNGEIKALKDNLIALDDDEAVLRAKLNNKIHSFNKTALKITRFERMPLEAMLFATNLRDAHNRNGIILQGKQSLKNRIQGDRAGIYELQKLQTEKEEKLAQTFELRKKISLRKKRLEASFAEQLALLELTNAERAQMIRDTQRMKKAKVLDGLFQMPRSFKKALPKVHKSYAKLPVEGKVTSHFNEKNDVGIHAKGITIASTSGAEVKAVKSGRIIYSGPFRDYGYIVILEHKGGVHSLYSGIKNSNYDVGKFIRSGEVIGMMPNSQKPTLYIEVRNGGKTIDPQRWLKS